VTAGPYRASRNPIYLGFAILYAAAAIGTRAVWPLVTLGGVIGAVDRWVIAREERYLATKFPTEFESYRRQTRRWA
jgi:protein-S-isoprenylcysteine O-methyltransferase Ste14